MFHVSLVTPNPIINEFNITVQSDKSQAINFKLINGEGRMVSSFTHHVLQGTNIFALIITSKREFIFASLFFRGSIRTVKVVKQ
jgi:hypothetical protein